MSSSRYTLFDMAKEVLRKTKCPMTYQDIWEMGKTLGLTDRLSISGKTPVKTLGAMLYTDCKGKNPRFGSVGIPAFFYVLGDFPNTDKAIKAVYEAAGVDYAVAPPTTKASYEEKDLHPLLGYYVFANPSFGNGKSVYTKTILHHKSEKKGHEKGYAKWVHPDMVGVYMPFDKWHPSLTKLSQKIAGNEMLLLYSFELKRSLNSGNYREAFFQAVSNSSWANEGYLVASHIAGNDDLTEELGRLSASFGIGLIEMDMEDIDSSIVRFPARRKSVLDWDTMNKLASLNKDFSDFLDRVKIDFGAGEIHVEKYDKIISDPTAYLEKLGQGKG